jgi:TfoX/Sxy family transcriptional regulator of competence genes
MAWIKIPAEHHPVFLAALPNDPRIRHLKMFGGLAAKANGQMFAGLFARSFVVKLDAEAQQEALALDGAAMFDPMGNGRIMRDTVHMPEQTFDEPAELRRWLKRSFDHVMMLPAKTEGKPARQAKPAKATPSRATKAKPARNTTRAPGKVNPKAKAKRR